MSQSIQIINLPLPLNIGSVNCYLITTASGCVLIDTGGSNKRAELIRVLEQEGCLPGELNLIIISHGDFDHIGNAAYLRREFDTKIAMHQDDTRMAEHGDMFWNRKKPNIAINILTPILIRFPKADRFSPDVILEDGYDLSNYGLEAKIISIPGHSRGSIGVLTNEGDLFCGDLLENTNKPGLNSIMDDIDTAKSSLEKLNGLRINTVYPGHGKPFKMSDLRKNQF